MPYQDVLQQQWNQIPEILEKTTQASAPGTSVLSEAMQNVGGFLGNMGDTVTDAFSSFGLGIKDTITMLL